MSKIRNAWEEHGRAMHRWKASSGWDALPLGWSKIRTHWEDMEGGRTGRKGAAGLWTRTEVLVLAIVTTLM